MAPTTCYASHLDSPLLREHIMHHPADSIGVMQPFQIHHLRRHSANCTVYR
jgi:hypothetical protein